MAWASLILNLKRVVIAQQDINLCALAVQMNETVKPQFFAFNQKQNSLVTPKKKKEFVETIETLI